MLNVNEIAKKSSSIFALILLINGFQPVFIGLLPEGSGLPVYQHKSQYRIDYHKDIYHSSHFRPSYRFLHTKRARP